MAVAGDMMRKSIVFDKATPEVFYCPIDKPTSFEKMYVRSRPLDKLCEFDGKGVSECVSAWLTKGLKTLTSLIGVSRGLVIRFDSVGSRYIGIRWCCGLVDVKGLVRLLWVRMYLVYLNGFKFKFQKKKV